MNGPILVADGEQNVYTMMKQTLSALNVPIQRAVNGEEALQLLASASGESMYSIVFLDLKLPGMDGLEVLRQIRRDWPGVRVVIVSAYGSVENVAEAMKLGAVDFLEKPFTPSELLDLASLILERQTLESSEAIRFQEWKELMNQPVSSHSEACAREIICRATATGPGRTDAFRLLAALFELGFRRLDEIQGMPVHREAPEPFIENE
ncbi:MAG: response regulator [Planctomycetia bacterium]|nr:response regulator [Planctomycetia bacterium]